MKFITEDDLRRMYREAPFGEYSEPEGSRLTPGGRQFLLDRGVTIGGRAAGKPGHLSQSPAGGDDDSDQDRRSTLALQTICAAFLQAGVDLLETDILLAQEVFTLEQYLAKLSHGEELAGQPAHLVVNGPDDGGDPRSSDLEINGFHAQTEKGREIVRLYYLKCLLLEQEPWLAGARREGVNSIISRLSQLICRALGGT